MCQLSDCILCMVDGEKPVGVFWKVFEGVLMENQYE